MRKLLTALTFGALPAIGIAQLLIISGPSGGPSSEGGGGVADCYTLSAGELAQIPWESGSGNWGAQVQFTEYTAPVTSGSTVFVSSEAEFETAAATDGQVIEFDASPGASNVLHIAADNLDIIIPEGITVGAFMKDAGEAALSNIRIRGETPCELSGGTMGQLRLAGDNIIIDGVYMRGDGGFGASEDSCVRFDGAGSLAIVNALASCMQGGVNFGGGAGQFYCRNFSLQAGGDSLDSGESTGQWAMRMESWRQYHVDCDWRNDKYASIRLAPVDGVSGELFWSLDSTYVNYADGRDFWAWKSNSGTDGPGEGFVLINPRLAAHADSGDGTCLGGANSHMAHDNGSGGVTSYTRIYSADVYSSGSVTANQAGFDSIASSSGDGDWDDGNNTFNTWASDLAWAGAGDPGTITQQSGTFEIGDGTCDPPSF
jgi:hypothetical protein